MKHLLLLLSCGIVLPTFAQQNDSLLVQRADTTERPDHQLSSALVVGARQNKVESAAMGLNYLRPEQIKSIPTLFGEADIIKALQMQPGVSPGLEGFAGMMVRGGNDDQNLFLIDGNPIYQMNHFGGLFSAYNIEAVRDVAFYKSSFPARYGGRLSSVVDIITKPGDVQKYHGSFNIGLTAANLAFSGPIVKNRSSFNIAVRRSWFDLLLTPLMALENASTKEEGVKNGFSYAFTDINVQLNHRFDRFGTLAFTGYYGNDRLTMESEYWNPRHLTGSNAYRNKIEGVMNWGNLLASLKWQIPIGKQWLHSLTSSFTRYGSFISTDEENQLGETGQSDYERTTLFHEVANGIQDYSLRSQWLWTGHKNAKVRLGLDYVYHHFSPEKVKERSNPPRQKSPYRNESLNAQDLSIYADGEIRPLSWLQINAGVRMSDFIVQGTNYFEFEPRWSANARLLPDMSIKAGYARMSQYVQQVSDAFISLPTDYWVPITNTLRPLTSDQYSIGAYYTLHNRWNFSVEGWYKKMYHLLEYRDGYDLLSASASWSEKLTSGVGTAKGIDFQVEKNFGQLAGFVGYGLLWTERLFEKNNGGRPYPSKYDNRHKINIALSFRATPRFEVNVAWTYISGSRTTLALEQYERSHTTNPDAPVTNDYDNRSSLDYINQKNNFQLPAYHRLDVGFNFYRPHKKSKRTSIWNISFYNAYSRMNPILLRKEEKSEVHVLPNGNISSETRLVFKSVSLFPIIPSVSYTLKF